LTKSVIGHRLLQQTATAANSEFRFLDSPSSAEAADFFAGLDFRKRRSPFSAAAQQNCLREKIEIARILIGECAHPRKG
jgi:hypothetical protein